MKLKGRITKTELKKRGWTDTIIEKTNLKPEFITPKTIYYSLSNVKRIERTKRFQLLYQESQRRKMTAKKAVETKTQKLLNYVDNVEIKIKYMDDRYITKNAIDAYNYWNRHSDKKASLYSDEFFLKRIKMNYVRHELTNYEEILEELGGKVGKNEAYYLIKKRIKNRIDNELREVFHKNNDFTL